MTTPTPTISPELRQILRRLKLGKMCDTLPERITLARNNQLSHVEFLELVLDDEVDRRNRISAVQRARTARLDPTMTLESWDPDAAVSYDRALLDELVSLRFVEDAHNVLILGPVKTG
jgi:hypothetical protein